MGVRFEELDYRETPIGAISLRRRWDPVHELDVYEVKLGDEFLMSSLFTVAEIALARLALDRLSGTDLDVVVGGLGLGYTALAVLDDPRVGRLTVVEALDPVVEWHRRGMLPLTAGLFTDQRAHVVVGDFFALAGADAGFAGDSRRYDAVLVDIDHSPSHVLHPANAAFYRPDGLRRLTRQLRPGGVFALWSNDPPEDSFSTVLADVFATAQAHVVSFPNRLQGRDATNTVYVAGCM